jgi:GH15 family glucan-1,4-alpha-glucosidase
VRQPARSPFPPIASYAFLSDCHTGALVAPHGTVEWLCVPRFDAPSVFGALLDRGAGGFRLGPYGVDVPGARRYEPGTNIVETTWMTPSGWVVVRDALTIGAWQDSSDPMSHTRPPTNTDADRVLVRAIECIQGSVQIELVCEPAFDYARAEAQWAQVDDNRVADATDGETTMRLSTDLMLGIEGNRARARHTLLEGGVIPSGRLIEPATPAGSSVRPLEIAVEAPSSNSARPPGLEPGVCAR